MARIASILLVLRLAASGDAAAAEPAYAAALRPLLLDAMKALSTPRRASSPRLSCALRDGRFAASSG